MIRGTSKFCFSSGCWLILCFSNVLQLESINCVGCAVPLDEKTFADQLKSMWGWTIYYGVVLFLTPYLGFVRGRTVRHRPGHYVPTTYDCTLLLLLPVATLASDKLASRIEQYE